jgi:hypothetical protein
VIAGLIAKFGGPALKYGLIALALAAAVVAALFYIDGVREEGYRAGEANVVTQVQTETIIIQKEIIRAENSAPRSPAGVSKRMREGSF